VPLDPVDDRTMAPPRPPCFCATRSTPKATPHVRARGSRRGVMRGGRRRPGSGRRNADGPLGENQVHQARERRQPWFRSARVPRECRRRAPTAPTWPPRTGGRRGAAPSRVENATA
jgi:hypothetical protein